MTGIRLQRRLATLELQSAAKESRTVLRPNSSPPVGGGTYIVAPNPCATASEWLAIYGPEAQHG